MSYMAHRVRLSMSQRLRLYELGELPREAVWGVRPPDAVIQFWEPPEMLDVASLVVDAVYMSFPTSVTEHLRQHPNPRTCDGGYRPMKRYQQNFYRKHMIAVTCRRYWLPYRGRGRTNRPSWEPCRMYLTSELIGLCVRRLLHEFRHRENAFLPPFPDFITPDEEYRTWEREAIQAVKEILELEGQLSRALGIGNQM